jgi:hypothetical protein
MEDSEARFRLSALEDRLLQRDHEFALLQCELGRQSQIERQNARVAALEKKFEEHSQHFEMQEASLAAAVVRLSHVEERLERQYQAQESTAAALTDAVVRLSRIEAEFAHIQSVSPPKATATPPSAKAAAPALGSKIISDFPEIFAEFRGKRFSLLWRGGRDGFGGRDFHDRCDGHANTLTLIEDTKGNIFGGFTPLEWESREWNGEDGKENSCCKADPSLKSFIFTLKNPHNVPARRFALKAERKDWAIYCNSDCGPLFNDIGVSNNCNANTTSFTWLGNCYTNDTGRDGKTFFTGSQFFQVKEIEVFEITD